MIGTTLQLSLQQDFHYWIESIQVQLDQITNVSNNGILQEISDSHLKRIRPSELTSSAFFDTLPMRKVNIDFVNPTTESQLFLKHVVG